MMSGTARGTGIAVTAAYGARVPFDLIVPDRSPANLAFLASEGKRWMETVKRYRELVTAHQLPYEVAQRAQFCEEALATCALMLQIGACCVLVAQAKDGRLLGVNNYTFRAPTEGAIALQAIDPAHLPGSPGHIQLRGIGTALTAAVGRELLRLGANVVYLHPLDPAAAVYWRSRGFYPCGGGGRFCIITRQAISRLIGRCEVVPCEADPKDECLLCGSTRAAALTRVPAFR